MIRWWDALPPWAQRLFAHLPGPVVEFVSGVLTTTLALILTWGMRGLAFWLVHELREPLHSTSGLFVAFLLAHILSVLYEAFVDPNGWEWPDVVQREVGIFTALAVWWWLLK